jgi:hypothetical protein
VRTRLVGDLQTELVTDLRVVRAPTCTSRPCMAAPTTTR